MRFDTEEAFFRATFSASGTSPSYISDACRIERLTDEGDWQKALRTKAVRLVRGAFDVHQRADAQLGPGDSLLGYRLQEAERELPEGWRIVIMVERGITRVDVDAPDDDRLEFSTVHQEVSGQVSDALREAIAASAPRVNT